jgi:cytochrome c
MKHPLIAAAATGITLAFLQTVASAAVDEAWAKKELKRHGCLTCHSIDKKKVGPAYKDVRGMFPGKSTAEVVSAMKSKSQHASVLKKTSDEDLNKMIEWILSIGK